MERVDIDGIELEYEVRGAGEPVLLVHGNYQADAFTPLLIEPALFAVAWPGLRAGSSLSC